MRNHVGLLPRNLAALINYHFQLLCLRINSYIYATDFISERFRRGECEVNGNPIGIIGNTLGYGLNQYAVGIGWHISPEVTTTISYWMNVLMACAPGDPNGSCPTESGGSFYDLYSYYNVSDPSVCGYQNDPPYYMGNITEGKLAKMAGIVIASVGGTIVLLVLLVYVFRKKETI